MKSIMKLYIETLGCPKNFNDSEGIAGLWEREGFEITWEIHEAQVILVNTCGFINDAKTESIDTIFNMIRIADEREAAGERRPFVIVSGCLSQRYARELESEMPEVDAFLGVNDYDKLVDVVKKLEGEVLDQKVYCSDAPKSFVEFEERKLPQNSVTATLRIAEGCNNRCAYCVIPQIRGGYRSRPMENIIEEAIRLSDEGIREIILIAQDVTEYGRDLYGELKLPELLRKLCAIGGDDLDRGFRWIRLMYCYEDKITDELIEVMAQEERICNYIDIPLQHLSDKVLTLMKRRSREKSIRYTIRRLREAIPDIHIRTTFITGFPQEAEEDFEKLADFVQETAFERLGVFAYSMEEGTVAGDMDGQIDEEIKLQRADSIMRMQVDISRESNLSKVGAILTVLVEDIDEDGAYVGRTQYDAPEIDNTVIFTADEGENIFPGQFVNVKVTDAFDYDLTGVKV